MNRIYGNLLSPFARKVYLMLDWKGAEYESVDVLPHAELPAFRAASPLGLVPAFEDETVRLCDSSVICDYLEHKYPSPRLYPADRSLRAQALWLEEYADTRLRALLLDGLLRERVANPVVRGIPTDAARVRQILEEEVPPELDYLNSRIEEPVFLVGEALSIADFAVALAFISAASADFKVAASRWPALSAYLEAIEQHPIVDQRLQAEAAFLRSLRGG